MPHEVFISYSSKDKEIADAIYSTLELDGIRCWIAPRNVKAGMSWTASIMNAIAESKVMVLVWTANANSSPDVVREVQHACRKGVVVIPIRIENVTPTKELEYYLEFVHWLDALTPPFQPHLKNLSENVSFHLLNGDRPKSHGRLNLNKAGKENTISSGRTKTLVSGKRLRIKSRNRVRMIFYAVILIAAGGLAKFSVEYLVEVPESRVYAVGENVKIINTGKMFDLINTDTEDCLEWPNQEVKVKGGRSGWDDFTPKNGQKGVVISVTKHCKDYERIYIVKVGEYYVPIGYKGVTTKYFW
jgi:hypothetical protein